jgi:hypothetical protein
MSDRSLAIRLAVIDGGKVKAELRDVGDSGARALQRIEEASRPASRALQALDGVAGELRGGLEEMAGRTSALGAGWRASARPGSPRPPRSAPSRSD